MRSRKQPPPPLTRRKLFYRDSGGLGHVLTSAGDGETIRIEYLDMVDLALLAADLLGETQPEVPRHSNLARWVIQHGRRLYGDRRFLHEVARALIWVPRE